MTRRLDTNRVLVLVNSRPDLDVEGWERLRRDADRCFLIKMSPFSVEEVSDSLSRSCGQDGDEALLRGRAAFSLLEDEPHVEDEAQVHNAMASVTAARGE
jgi:hypothetical protein